MGAIDFLEIKQLLRSAEVAIMSGELNEWQHATTSTFHLLGTAVVNLHDRLAQLESSPDQPVETRIVLDTE